MTKKLFYVILFLFFISRINIFGQSPVLTVTNHYTGSYYVASGSYTDNRSTGHHFHFTSQSIAIPNFVWWVKITINNEIIYEGSFGDGTYAEPLDLYVPAHRYDVVNIQVNPNLPTGGGSGTWNEYGKVYLYIGEGSIESR